MEVAASASAGTACTGGQTVAHTVGAGTTTGQKRILMIRLIQISRHGLSGAIGISPGSRHTGAEAGHSIRPITARVLQNIKVAR